MPDNKLIIDDINEQEGVAWLTLNRPRIGNLKGIFTPPLPPLTAGLPPPPAAARGLDRPLRMGAVSASGVLRGRGPWDGPSWEQSEG
jgi:hypothetical protein